MPEALREVVNVRLPLRGSERPAAWKEGERKRGRKGERGRDGRRGGKGTERGISNSTHDCSADVVTLLPLPNVGRGKLRGEVRNVRLTAESGSTIIRSVDVPHRETANETIASDL